MRSKNPPQKIMPLSELGEFGLIKDLKKKCSFTAPEIILGIGDDAAAIQVKNKKLLITTDMMIEGVHFDLSFTTFHQLGYKFLAINISDIFAMGGAPKYFVISLGIPPQSNTGDIKDLYAGIMNLAVKYGISIVGGDTCASRNDLVLNGTLLGETNKIISRSGAQEGDGIYVTGTLGDSAMGLALLIKQAKEIHNFSPSTTAMKLMKKHLLPEPAPFITAQMVTSMIDISDGLLIDLSHICDESKVGAVIYKDKIPVSRELAETAARLNEDPLDYALKGGEDYVLLLTSPSNIKTEAFKIGEIIKKGRYIIDTKGKKTAFKAEGYEHFKG